MSDASALAEKYRELAARFRRIVGLPDAAPVMMRHATARGGRLIAEAVDGGLIDTGYSGLADVIRDAQRPRETPEDETRVYSTLWTMFVVALSKSVPRIGSDPLAIHYAPAVDGCRVGRSKPDEWRIRCDSYADAAEYLAERIDAATPAKRLAANEATGKRPAYRRDQLWLNWYEEDHLGPAKIRDRWDAMSDHERIAACSTCCERVGGNDDKSRRAGREVVKNGLKEARKDRKGRSRSKVAQKKIRKSGNSPRSPRSSPRSRPV
jgi:hypothetical protein